MLNGTTKAAGLLALGLLRVCVCACALPACGSSAPSAAGAGAGGGEVAGAELASAPLQAELDTFSRAARLDLKQRAALLKHFQRFEKHYASLARTGKTELIERLLEHDRILALSELRTDQVKPYDAARLPGSRSFAPALLLPAGGAP
jgi:hypothetical protein